MIVGIAPAFGRKGLHRDICLGINESGNNLKILNRLNVSSDTKLCDVVCVIGYKNIGIRRAIRRKANKFSIPIVFIDNGVFQYFGKFLLVTVDGIKRHGLDYTKALNMKPRPLFARRFIAKEWKNHDKNTVTVLAHNASGYREMSQSKDSQLRDVYSVESQLRSLGYETQISWHPRTKKKTISLKSICKSSLFCVGWHTNSLCTSLLEGVPTVCLDGDAVAYELSAHSIDSELLYPDRTEWIRSLSWAHWSTHEVASGVFWSRIKLEEYIHQLKEGK